MALDRGTLAKIDRSILSELDHGQGVQLVKVPLSDAVWSTWRRYCGAVHLTMGAGIAGLIAYELGTLLNDDGHHGGVFAAESQSQLAARSEALDVRERRLAKREQSLKASERLLRGRTRPLDTTSREALVGMSPALAARASSTNNVTATERTTESELWMLPRLHDLGHG